MKKIKLIFAAALLSLSYGCSDELLDNSGTSGESQPTEDLTSAQLGYGAQTNPLISTAFMSGAYAQMVQRGSGGSTSHVDFGHKSYDVFGDMVSGDMSLSVSTYGWYRASITELQGPQDFTRGENRMIWRYYYRIIRSANTIIQTYGGSDATPESELGRHQMGQAKALRAHSYFYLTQYFQKKYNASEPILPMPTEPGGNLAKSTAEEIYNLMEQDLTDAISLLSDFNRTNKSAINQDVARLILAYVLGAKGGRDAEVAALTQQVINSGNYTMLSPAEVTNGFNNVNTPSWMWGIDITPVLSLGLISWWGQIDAYSYSYAWAGDYKVIDADLFAAIPANDARKAQFLDAPTNGRHLQPLLKFYFSAAVAGSTAFGAGPQSGITADYVYMRVEEAYLLNAEANARAGNDAGARASLKALLQRRIPDASYVDGLSGQALLDEIYLQTRIELWGEGKSYLAMKRNKATVTRGSNHLSLVGVPLQYDEERMTFEIPQDEIQNNPFISSQNL